MARHKQKDEEAGAEGCGILNTRKYYVNYQTYLTAMLTALRQAHVERRGRQDRN
jgi:hypothetical protein